MKHALPMERLKPANAGQKKAADTTAAGLCLTRAGLAVPAAAAAERRLHSRLLN
ncbi:hypothetical protein [Rhodanobacter sp. A1T4]|uniref:hypothetical protein n=1 Tax=Rhodanobacter sp. A1T4 TaxID=2723087 RepID=UPI001617D20A|nr:hypothetical protein [Rhodanobacter sp. A1T4]MBB6245477.1 hypothetical protein [Rhodanobacter sp. A1T4]